MRIHISYSDRFFHPEKDYSKYNWHITSRIAYHVWKVLSESFSKVTYGDDVPSEPLDILWTNRIFEKNHNIKAVGYIASVAHYSYIYSQINKYKSLADSKPEGLYSLKERWLNYRGYANSDVIVYAGNDRVGNSFKMFPNPYKTSFMRTNWGVDYDYFRPQDNISRDELLFLYCCTKFTLRKGSHIVEAAWKELIKKVPKARLLLIAGDGDFDLSSRLKEYPSVERLNISSLGNKDYLQALSRAKWIILPSLAEGQAGSLLEAMSCGCVPIASLDTGINADEYHGYIIEPNTPNNLVNIMVQAIEKWTPSLANMVREDVKTKHKWSGFEMKIIEATNYLKSTMELQNKSKIKTVYNFILNEYLRVL